MTRFTKTKIALIAALAVARLAATPAFGQSFTPGFGTGNVLPSPSRPAAADVASHRAEAAPRHASVHATRGNGVNAYAMAPRARSDFDSESPSSTGGGSIGYNENLYNYEATASRQKRASFGSPFSLDAYESWINAELFII